MSKIFLYIISPILRLAAKIYTSTEREYIYRGIKVLVKPGVFHPGLYFSTKILINALEKIELKNKNFLELGAGSGFISIFASKKGAKVTATDINDLAIENIKTNFSLNDINAEIISSDLFQNISPIEFDIIVINPPYFPKDPLTNYDYAWYCGKGFEYFYNLFVELKKFISSETIILMILSENCELERILSIAKKYGFILKEFHSEKKWGEKSTVFRVSKN